MIRARLYVPKGMADAPGIVIVHGVHHLGIDEPRMVAFTRAVSASGIRVLTPELQSLADYHVDPSAIDLIGASARMFATSIGQKVGVLGLSFAGGLSLMAASEPQYEPYIRFVLSMGAHDDLERVSHFLVTGRILRPDGSTLQIAPHEYGPLILIYSRLEDFFPPADVGAAHDALQQLLWENAGESQKRAELLSPPSRQKMDLLYSHHLEPLSGEMEAAIGKHRAEMWPVSPHGHLGSLRVPVLMLHGAGDNVIPPSELLWLQQDVPAKMLVAALVSPALSHLDMKSEPSFMDNFRLVRFIAQMLELSGDEQAAGR